MKFLCVPCDSPMTLQTIAPPDRGSLSVVYACPECGYEMAMLTNAYETQVVQSLGVRIGPDAGGGTAARAGAAAGAPGGVTPGPAAEVPASGSRCPFSAMIPPAMTTAVDGRRAADDAQHLDAAQGPDAARGLAVQAGEPAAVRWTEAAEARLANIPDFVRPMARLGIERFARERGSREVDERILEAARDFFGM